MGKHNEISRREFIITTAATLLVTHAPIDSPQQENPYKDVDWEMVINKVVGDRNALLMGYKTDFESYPVDSPEWIMEEVLAIHFPPPEGARIHV